MTELLEKDQIFSIVPQNFKNSNKGKIIDIQDNTFSLEFLHPPEGILPKKIMEFYSHTKNGMLYFTSSVIEIEDNKFVVAMPRKHRFLQRRAFTRINFSQCLSLETNNKSYEVKAINISVGGIKICAKEALDINTEYSLTLNLSDKNTIKCMFEPIKIEKKEDSDYTLSGRFKNLSNTDKITLIQFCMMKNIENVNK